MTRTSETNALDGMRGIASVIVLMNHLVLAFLSSDFLARAVNAKLAVVFFFVHSGFVLSVAPLSTDEEVATRMARRYVRLAPLVVVSCLAAWVLLLFGQIRVSGSSSAWLASFYQFDCDVFYALYAGFFHSFFVVKGETVASLNPVLWTIGTELAGSVLVFMFVATFRRHLAQRAVGYILMALCFKPFLAFFVGVFLADLWVNRRAAFSGLVGAVSLVAGVLLAYLSAFEFVGFHIGSAISSGLILASVLALKPIRSFLETKPFLLLGKISFSIYVIHFPILASLGAQVHASTSNVTLACTATIGATLIGGLVLERLVDRPGIAMSKRFGAWLARQNA